MDDLDTGKATLAASISHRPNDSRLGCGGEFEPESLVVFVESSNRKIDKWLGLGGLLHQGVRELIVKVVVEAYTVCMVLIRGCDRAEIVEYSTLVVIG